ncbi:MAG TPA: MarR family transcriptional regulator [Candidatus Brachybacterium merdigallinarum]|nr:MarR family transcriptional regulator [Candidatus Brachybacterium merdigallinarum]
MRRLLLVSSRILRTRTSSEQISASQYSVLAFLDRSGSATPGAIAEFEHVSPPVMTRTLDRLETAGLVARAAHPGDGRQVLVTLTATGADLVHRGRQERDDWLSSRIEATDPAERDALDAAVDLLTRTLIERPDSTPPR